MFSNVKNLLDLYKLPEKILVVGRLGSKLVRSSSSLIFMSSFRDDSKYFIQEPFLIAFYIEELRRLIIYKPSGDRQFSIWSHATDYGEVEVRLIKGGIDELLRIGFPEVLLTVIKKGSVNKTMFYNELKKVKPVLPNKEYYDSLKKGEKKPVLVTYDIISSLTSLIDADSFSVKRVKGRTFFRWISSEFANNFSIDYHFKVPNPKSRVTLRSMMQLRYRGLVRLEIPVIDILNIEAFNLSELSVVKRVKELLRTKPMEGVALANIIIRGNWGLNKLADKYHTNIFKTGVKFENVSGDELGVLNAVYSIGMVYELLDLIISARAESIIKEKEKDIVYINNVGAYYFYKRYFEDIPKGLDRPIAGYVPKYLTEHNGTVLKVRVVNYKDKMQSLAAKNVQFKDFKLQGIRETGYHYDAKYHTIVLKIVKKNALLLGKDVAVIKVEGNIEGKPVKYIITGVNSIDEGLKFAKNHKLQLAKFD